MKAGRHHFAGRANNSLSGVGTSALLPGGEHGASSGEFIFAVLVLALAIMLGGLGGVWIARREGPQKPKALEPEPVLQQPADQQPKPAEIVRTPEVPAKAPSLTPKPAVEPKPQAAKPAVRPAGLHLPSLEAISYSSQAGTTQVTIDIGEASLVKAAGLSSPERIYFDFEPGHRTQAARGRLDKQESRNIKGNALLGGIRVARWHSGDVRVVLDLKCRCDFSYHLLPQPASRLIVELKARPDSGADPKEPEVKAGF